MTKYQPGLSPGHVVRPAQRSALYPDQSEREAPRLRRSQRQHPRPRAPVHGRAVQDRGARC